MPPKSGAQKESAAGTRTLRAMSAPGRTPVPPLALAQGTRGHSTPAAQMKGARKVGSGVALKKAGRAPGASFREKMRNWTPPTLATPPELLTGEPPAKRQRTEPPPPPPQAGGSSRTLPLPLKPEKGKAKPKAKAGKGKLAKGPESIEDKMIRAILQSVEETWKWCQEGRKLFIDVHKVATDPQAALDAVEVFAQCGVLFAMNPIRRETVVKAVNQLKHATGRLYERNAGDDGSCSLIFQDKERMINLPCKTSSLLRPLLSKSDPNYKLKGSSWKEGPMWFDPLDVARFPILEDEPDLLCASILIQTRGRQDLLDRCFCPPDTWKARAAPSESDSPPLPADQTRNSFLRTPRSSSSCVDFGCTPPHTDIYGSASMVELEEANKKGKEGGAAGGALKMDTYPNVRTQAMLFAFEGIEPLPVGSPYKATTTGKQKNGPRLFFVPGSHKVIDALFKVEGLNPDVAQGFLKVNNTELKKLYSRYGVTPMFDGGRGESAHVWWNNVIHFETSDYALSVPQAQSPQQRRHAAGPNLLRSGSYTVKVPPRTVSIRVCTGLFSPAKVKDETFLDYARVRSLEWKLKNANKSNKESPLVVDAFSCAFTRGIQVTEAEVAEQKRHLAKGDKLDEFSPLSRWLLGERLDVLKILGKDFANVFRGMQKSIPPPPNLSMGLAPPASAPAAASSAGAAADDDDASAAASGSQAESGRESENEDEMQEDSDE